MRKDFRRISVKNSTQINRIEKFIEEICDYYNISNEYFGNILMAITEATGILFSLHDDKGSYEVIISFERNHKGLIFRISFNSENEHFVAAEDLLDKEIRKHRLSKEIFIIKSLADEIYIAIDGNSIVLTFYISSINYEKSLQRINKLKEYLSTVHSKVKE